MRAYMWRNCVFVLGCFMVFTVLLSGCGGGGGGGGVTPNNYDNLFTDDNTDKTTDKILSGAVVTESSSQGQISAVVSAGRIAASIQPEHVSNPSGVEGAQVTLTPDSGAPVTVQTDANGEFSFLLEDLQPTIYEVKIISGSKNCSYYIDLSDGSRELLTELEDEDCYTTVISLGEPGWKHEIDPDGAFVITRNGQPIALHTADGVTVFYDDDGSEDWYLDENGNFKADDNDPKAPALDSTSDTDGDGCHNMMDFSDNDNDNDNKVNFGDSDYNTNLLAANMMMVETNCINTIPFYSLELEVTPDSGDAPLTVTAKAVIRGAPGNIEKFIWRTGKPGVAPIETTVPQTTITYNQYGAFILSVEVHLKNGSKVIDTYPVSVMKSNYTGGMSFLEEMNSSCSGTEHCDTLDIDVDQYGNMFILIDTWSSSDRYKVDVLSPDKTSIVETNTLASADPSITCYPVNMTLDDNGFIYTLGFCKRIGIYNASGGLIDSIDISEIGGAADIKGIAVDESGNVYFGNMPVGGPIKIYKCSKENGEYECSVLAQTNSESTFVALLDTDLEIDPRGYVALLNLTKIKYFNTSGSLVETFDLGEYGSYTNLAIGPDGKIFVTREYTVGAASGIDVFSASGEHLYYIPPDIEDDEMHWDLYVDNLGKLYVTSYTRGTVLVYAPDYMTPTAARVASAVTETGGFRVRRVNAVSLQQ